MIEHLGTRHQQVFTLTQVDIYKLVKNDRWGVFLLQIKRANILLPTTSLRGAHPTPPTRPKTPRWRGTSGGPVVTFVAETPAGWVFQGPGGAADLWFQAVMLLMEEILHQLIGSLSHYLQGFIHPRWCRISSINSIFLVWWLKNQPIWKKYDPQNGFISSSSPNFAGWRYKNMWNEKPPPSLFHRTKKH